MKIPVSKVIALCGLRLLRITLEKAMLLLSYLVGMVVGLIQICAGKMEVLRRKDEPGTDDNQTLPPYRFD